MIAIKGVIMEIPAITVEDLQASLKEKGAEYCRGFIGEMAAMTIYLKPAALGGAGIYKNIYRVKFGKPGEDNRKNPDWEKDIDFIATNNESIVGTHYTTTDDDVQVEVKTQTGILKWGNVLLEEKIINRYDGTHIKDGWFKTTEADMFVFVQSWEELEVGYLDTTQEETRELCDVFKQICEGLNLEPIYFSIFIPAFAVKVSDMRKYVTEHQSRLYTAIVDDEKNRTKQARCIKVPLEELLAEGLCEVYLINVSRTSWNSGLHNGYGISQKDIYGLIDYKIRGTGKKPAYYRGLLAKRIKEKLESMNVKSVPTGIRIVMPIDDTKLYILQ